MNGTRKIEIEVPEELLINLKQSDEEFKKELKLLMAIDFVESLFSIIRRMKQPTNCKTSKI